jgi:hypothetical protein
MGANFLPFDSHLFKYPTTLGTQETAFRNLNVDIVRGVSTNTLTGNAIVDVIDNGLYAANSATQTDEVVPGWDPGNPNSNRHRFYHDVLARACRTCHISQPLGNTNTFQTAPLFEDLITRIQDLVCVAHVMPHAQRTNDIFWNSLNPNMPAFLTLYGQTGSTGQTKLPGWNAAPNSQCSQGPVQGGSTAPSVFQSQIFSIMTTGQTTCASCHGQVGNANFSVGQGPVEAYNGVHGLLTTTAKDGTSKYIKPNDPSSSLLYHRITTGVPGQRMPQNGPDLTVTPPSPNVSDADQILAWINAGAVGP